MPYADKAEQLRAQRFWVRRRRADWIRDNGPCRKCGSSNGLQVDHIDPRTKISHNVWSWKEDRRLAELAKCQVLCKDCHLWKTVAARKSKAACGTTARYQRGCRCGLCKRAHADYAMERKKGLRAKARRPRKRRRVVRRAKAKARSLTPRQLKAIRLEQIRQRYLEKYPERATEATPNRSDIPESYRNLTPRDAKAASSAALVGRAQEPHTTATLTPHSNG